MDPRTLVVAQDLSSTGWRGGLTRRAATKSSRGGWGTDVGRLLIRSLRGGRLHLWVGTESEVVRLTKVMVLK